VHPIPADGVLQTQRCYRHLVDAMARPGTLHELGTVTGTGHDAHGLPIGIDVVAHTLLDAEATFAVHGPDPRTVTRILRERTNARPVAPSEAQFLFLLTPDTDATRILATAPIGTLTAPHLGATVIIDAQHLGDGEPGAASPYRHAVHLDGPGIPGTRTVSIDVAFDWRTPRSERNATFPLGIDLIFIDPTARMLALPRTTRVTDTQAGGA